MRFTCFQATKSENCLCNQCTYTIEAGSLAVRDIDQRQHVVHDKCLLNHVVRTAGGKACVVELFQSHLLPQELVISLQNGFATLDGGYRLVTVQRKQSAKDATPITPSVVANQLVTPWEVQCTEANGIKYDRLIEEFGTQRIDDALISRMERIIGEPVHPWLRRGLVFSHRDLDKMLNLVEAGERFYIYTGRGPSSKALHLGHLVPFQLCVWLQRVFHAPIVIQMTDDEKFLWNADLSLDQTREMSRLNALDILACGFNPARTFIFSNMDYIGALYPNVCRLQKVMSLHTIGKTFGISMDKHNIGQAAFPAIQAAPCFASSFPALFGDQASVPCLVAMSIDQDVYFRLTRDAAPRLRERKPALLHGKFLSALQGAHTKMSSSNEKSAVFVTDAIHVMAHKIHSFAFSGGRQTRAEHEAHGGNTSIDVAYQWLTFFEYDDARLAHIKSEYESGRMSTSEIKQTLVDCLTPLLLKHQAARTTIDDAVLNLVMTPRPLNL